MPDLPSGWVTLCVALGSAAIAAIASWATTHARLSAVEKRVEAHDDLEAVLTKALGAMEQQTVRFEAAIQTLTDRITHTQELTNLQFKHLVERFDKIEKEIA